MLETFLQKDSNGHWNTIPPVPKDKIGNVNCHKFILYIIGRISFDEMISDSKVQKGSGLDFTFGEMARNISGAPFVSIQDIKSLYEFAEKNLGSVEAYIGQILDTQTNEMAHSFIVERESDKFTCLDKQGFKYPFTVYDMKIILDFVNKDGERPYLNQKWRFLSLNDLKS